MPRNTASKLKRTKSTAADKDPNRPKKPLSSYMFFTKDRREEIKKDNPGESLGGLAKIIGALWQELDDEDKEQYQAEAAKDKERYNKQMLNYTPPAGFKKTKAKKEKDPNAPKKPMTAFFAWMGDNRQRIKDENEGCKFTDIGKIGGAEWRELDDETKNEYENNYKSKMEDYRAEMADYAPSSDGPSKAKKSKSVKHVPVELSSSDEAGSASESE